MTAMDPFARVNSVLERILDDVAASESPPKLSAAMKYALFPGGARIRPRLCYAVAAANGIDAPEITDAAAAAVELMHCASLVHDDLPCFDNADTRRGKPSVHKAFGEDIALLVGDGLIVLAFDVLANATADRPERLHGLVKVLSRSVGAVSGIIAGQAWESEDVIDTEVYQRAKTGALFAAATESGAASTGVSAPPWRLLGEKIGEAYQIADDILDVCSTPEKIGKPVGQDAALGRPSIALEYGLANAAAQLRDRVANAVESIPVCQGRAQLVETILFESSQFVPPEILKQAA